MNSSHSIGSDRRTRAAAGAGTLAGTKSALSLAALALPAPLAQAVRLAAFLVIVGALMAWGSPPLALVAGVLFAISLGNPLPRHGHKLAKYLLQACVVMLGFGMNLSTVLQAGLHGAMFAAVTIGTTLFLGYWLGKALGAASNISTLISAGTAICGGSAIAAVGSVLAVTEAEIAVAMGTVFVLNAVALYLFPVVGHALHLSPHQFGTWAGVAIHDISSVVGASVVYGQEALETATAVKLSRSLWIVPLTLGIAFTLGQRARKAAAVAPTSVTGTERKGGGLGVELPWFIGLFLLASVARSYIPLVGLWSPNIASVARAGLVLVLCLIGTSLSARTLRTVGWQAAVQGVALWGFISVGSLLAILYGHVG